MKYLYLIWGLLCTWSVLAQQVPADPQSQPILIMNATAHLGNGKKIENAALAFENGKLTVIADARVVKLDMGKFRVINGKGKHIYPGFIALNTEIGLKEIDAVRATRDNREVGTFNPSVRALIAYNTDSRVTPTIRSNGVMIAQIVPQGGRVSGLSSVMKLDGWNWDDATYKADDGIHLRWPLTFRQTGWWAVPGTIVKNKKYKEETQKVKDFFLAARAYHQATTHKVKNLKFESMRGLFDGTKRLYIHVNAAKSILETVLWAKEIGVPNMIVVGGSDAWKIASFLKENKTPVILTKTQNLPVREDDDIDQMYKNPKILADAGVHFAFSMNGAWEQRNLVFQAGQAVAYGLEYEKAIQGLTLDAARILGIDKTTGSLETGKDATLILVEGDVLDMKTCIISKAFIQGREIDLDNKQKALSRKFSKKYGVDVKNDE